MRSLGIFPATCARKLPVKSVHMVHSCGSSTVGRWQELQQLVYWLIGRQIIRSRDVTTHSTHDSRYDFLTIFFLNKMRLKANYDWKLLLELFLTKKLLLLLHSHYGARLYAASCRLCYLCSSLSSCNICTLLSSNILSSHLFHFLFATVRTCPPVTTRCRPTAHVWTTDSGK